MKRYTYIILFLMAVLSIGSCKKHAPADASEPKKQVFTSPDLTYEGLADSVKDVLVRHYEAEMKGDTMVIDRTAAQYVTTLTFDKRGYLSSHAMRIYTPEFPNGQVYNDFKLKFDDNGELVMASPSAKAFKILRNDAGYIVEFSFTSAADPSLGYQKLLTWNDNGQLVNLTYTGDGEISEEDYAYNDRGLLSRVVAINTFGDVREESDKTFRYTAFDSRDNWTRREIVTVVKSTEVGQEPNTHINYTIETRDITYY